MCHWIKFLLWIYYGHSLLKGRTYLGREVAFTNFAFLALFSCLPNELRRGTTHLYNQTSERLPKAVEKGQ
jgi:hypothetical protein